MEQHSIKEVELSQLFGGAKSFMKRIIRLFVRTFHFLKRNLLLLAGLIILGVAIGLVLKHFREHNSKANLLIQINVEAQNYVYNAVDELMDELNDQKDSATANGIFRYKDQIKKLEIKPLINVDEILDEYQNYNHEQVLLLLDNIETENDFLEAPTFRTIYEYHQIEIILSEDANEEVILALIDYLNSNDHYQNKVAITTRGIKRLQEEDLFTLKTIDTLLLNFSKKIGEKNQSSGNAAIILGENSLDMRGIIDKKQNLLYEIDQLENDLAELTGTVKLLNAPAITSKKSIWDSLVLFPIIFIFLFILTAFAKHLSRWSKTSN